MIRSCYVNIWERRGSLILSRQSCSPWCRGNGCQKICCHRDCCHTNSKKLQLFFFENQSINGLNEVTFFIIPKIFLELMPWFENRMNCSIDNSHYFMWEQFIFKLPRIRIESIRNNLHAITCPIPLITFDTTNEDTPNSCSRWICKSHCAFKRISATTVTPTQTG